MFVDYKDTRINEYTTQTSVKKAFSNIIETRYLSRNSTVYISFKEAEVYKKILKDLELFSEVFTIYIGSIINQLEPAKPFDTFGDLTKEIDAVYTFNYSNTFERLYPNSLENQLNQVEVQYIHGSAERKNIVLGISDLDEENLRRYKVYGFVKTFQKLINNTDYRFLDNTELKYLKGVYPQQGEEYEIIIWGHSLDASDSEYIKEIFTLNNITMRNKVSVIVWCHGSPHTQLANLMHIMGKDIIQEWMKKGWLVFEAAPDIYQLNKQKQSLLEIA